MALSHRQNVLSSLDLFILPSLELVWTGAFVLFCFWGVANVGVLIDVLTCRLDIKYLPSSLPMAWSSSDDADEDDGDDAIDDC